MTRTLITNLGWVMLFSVLMGGSCCRKSPPVVSIPPKKPVFSIISSYTVTIRDWNPVNVSNQTDYFRDTTLTDSVFYMFRPNPASSFSNQSYNFKLVYENVIRLNKVEWIVGNDTRPRSGVGISLVFGNPVGKIPITCFVNYTYKVNDFEFDTKSDTLTKYISINGIDSAKFIYRGVDTRYPSDTILVQLNWDADLVLPSSNQQPFFNIRGLPKNYPYAIGMGLANNNFSFSSYPSHDEAWPAMIDNKYIVQVNGYGFYKNNFDSVFIRYYYFEKPEREYTSAARSRMGEFIGKRIF